MLWDIGCLNVWTQSDIEAIVAKLEKEDTSDEEVEVVGKKEKDDEDSNN